MAKSDYLPPADASFDQWLTNFLAQMGLLAAQLGITAAEVTEQGSLVSTWDTEFDDWTTKDAEAKQQRAKKDAARAAWEAKGRPLVRRIKAHPGYTEAIGQLLKVIGPEDTTDLSGSKPKVTAKLLPGGQVEIGFGKSKADGVNIYSQRDGDAAKQFLARDTESPYVDTRALLVAGKPEVRRYSGVFVVNDAEVGQSSDEVVVTVTP